MVAGADNACALTKQEIETDNQPTCLNVAAVEARAGAGGGRAEDAMGDPGELGADDGASQDAAEDRKNVAEQGRGTLAGLRRRRPHNEEEKGV
ncbi:unnamed protein product [Discosporangium mesarthrocarpum]